MDGTFTFINTTDSPSLGTSAAKSMRAHVTKTNFAQRRKRIARHLQQQRDAARQDSAESHQNSHSGAVVAFSRQMDADLPLFMYSPADSGAYVQFVMTELRPLLFPKSVNGPLDTFERSWVDLVMVEPALLEASIALASNYGRSIPNVAGEDSNSEYHVARAVRMINKQLDAGVLGLTDGLIGAVFTLASVEWMKGNESAWRAHVLGLKEIIRLKNLHSRSESLPWISDLITYESISSAVGKSVLCGKLVFSFTNLDHSDVSAGVATVHDSVMQLKQGLNASRDSPGLLSSLGSMSQVKNLISDIETKVDRFDTRGPYMRAVAIAMRIFLHLSWPESPLSKSQLGSLSKELKDTMGTPNVRLCASLELTTWQLMVGLIAASDPVTRCWYTSVLERFFVVLDLYSWDHGLMVFYKTMIPDAAVLRQFKSAWEEVRSRLNHPVVC